MGGSEPGLCCGCYLCLLESLKRVAFILLVQYPIANRFQSATTSLSYLKIESLATIYENLPWVRKPQRLTFFHRNRVWLAETEFAGTGFEFVSTVSVGMNSDPVR